MLHVNFSCYGSYTGDSVYQWDLGHKVEITGLTISGNAPTVQFCNKKCTTAIVVQSTVVNNVITADLPNELLEQPYDIIGYIHTYANNEATTIEKMTIPLIPRTKPDDYQFTQNIDVMNFERLESDFTDLEESFEDYKTEYTEDYTSFIAECDAEIEEIRTQTLSMDGGYPDTTYEEG